MTTKTYTGEEQQILDDLDCALRALRVSCPDLIDMDPEDSWPAEARVRLERVRATLADVFGE